MTDRERIEVSELKVAMIHRAGGRCEVCGSDVGPYNTQLAHRIPQSNANLKKYGKEIVHHHYNLAVTCGLECNGAVIVHGLEEERLVARIRDDLNQHHLFAGMYDDDRLDGLW